jgi:hypothetical protein
LQFPGRFALQYPLYDYPRIAELRTILERLELRDTLIFWESRYFLGSTWLGGHPLLSGVSLTLEINR